MSCRVFRPLPTGVARATTEHMPFVGHRTVAQIWAQSAAHRNACEYGFDPESLRKAAPK
jgi:hypothetical protein